MKRGKADGVIVSGAATGAAVDPDRVAEVVELAGNCPVLIGSGVDESNVARLLGLASGLIVGTSVKEGGRTTGAVDRARAQSLVAEARNELGRS